MNFIEEHWGDLIGLLLLYTGIVLAIVAALVQPGGQSLTHLGESLVLAGMGVLKLRGKNGEGHVAQPDGAATGAPAPASSAPARAKAVAKERP
jgi:hypothetical protein